MHESSVCKTSLTNCLPIVPVHVQFIKSVPISPSVFHCILAIAIAFLSILCFLFLLTFGKYSLSPLKQPHLTVVLFSNFSSLTPIFCSFVSVADEASAET